MPGGECQVGSRAISARPHRHHHFVALHSIHFWNCYTILLSDEAPSLLLMSDERCLRAFCSSFRSSAALSALSAHTHRDNCLRSLSKPFQTSRSHSSTATAMGGASSGGDCDGASSADKLNVSDGGASSGRRLRWGPIAPLSSEERLHAMENDLHR